jgi:hypothetical protein
VSEPTPGRWYAHRYFRPQNTWYVGTTKRVSKRPELTMVADELKEADAKLIVRLHNEWLERSA